MDGSVIIRSNMSTPDSVISSFVVSRSSWVRKHLDRIENARTNVPVIPDGGWIHHLGDLMPIRDIPGLSHIPEADLPPEKRQELLIQALRRWRILEGGRITQLLVDALLPMIPDSGRVRYRSFRFKFMRTRWGSCSARGMINLNIALLSAPVECLQSVLVHELCHLVHLRHNQAFYELMDSTMADWRSADILLGDWATVLLPNRSLRLQPTSVKSWISLEI